MSFLKEMTFVGLIKVTERKRETRKGSILKRVYMVSIISKRRKALREGFKSPDEVKNASKGKSP